MTSDPQVEDAAAVAETRLGALQGVVRWPSASLVVDEPAARGGQGGGPNPYELLSAALGTCTMMTLRLYSDRKGWPLARVHVDVRHRRPAGGRDLFERTITLEGALDADQQERLREIAERCPVHLTLSRGSDIATSLAAPATAARPDAASEARP